MQSGFLSPHSHRRQKGGTLPSAGGSTTAGHTQSSGPRTLAPDRHQRRGLRAEDNTFALVFAFLLFCVCYNLHLRAFKHFFSQFYRITRCLIYDSAWLIKILASVCHSTTKLNYIHQLILCPYHFSTSLYFISTFVSWSLIKQSSVYCISVFSLSLSVKSDEGELWYGHPQATTSGTSVHETEVFTQSHSPLLS